MPFLAYTEINKEDERQRRDCDIDNPPMDGKVCRVDVTNQFGMCAREHDFGYSRSSPCIFLKLDTVGIRVFLLSFTKNLKSDFCRTLTGLLNSTIGPMIYRK